MAGSLHIDDMLSVDLPLDKERVSLEVCGVGGGGILGLKTPLDWDWDLSKPLSNPIGTSTGNTCLAPAVIAKKTKKLDNVTILNKIIKRYLA